MKAPLGILGFFILSLTNAWAFDMQQGRWMIWADSERHPILVGNLQVNSAKDFKGYTLFRFGSVYRTTGNVNDGKKYTLIFAKYKENGDDLIRRGLLNLGPDSPDRPTKFTATYANTMVTMWRVGNTYSKAGAYAGVNSAGETVTILVFPDRRIVMTFQSPSRSLSLHGKLSGNKVVLKDGKKDIRIELTVNAGRFHGEGVWRHPISKDITNVRLFGNRVDDTTKEFF